MPNRRDRGPAAKLLIDHGTLDFLKEFFCYVVLLVYYYTLMR